VQVHRTQDPGYWQSFKPDEADLDSLRELIAEARRPVALEELARSIVFRRVHAERDRLRRLLEQGRFYRPADSYEVGQELIFPAFDLAAGAVTAKRDAYWPGHSPFKVISVQLGDQVREFASEYQEPHPLNQSMPDSQGAGDGMAPEAVFEANRGAAMAALAAVLQQEPDFVAYGGAVLLRQMMPEVHVGYLNLAEAVIEVAWEQAAEAGGVQAPLSTDEIMKQIELRADTPEIGRFALELALRGDDRFVDVGTDARALWLLRRLVPPQVLETPERLQYQPVPFSIEAIPTEALELIWAIPDEHGDIGAGGPGAEATMSRTEIALPYPHWRAGSLPLAGPVAAVLPRKPEGISVITLHDQANNERITAWISHAGRYVYGLADWLERHGIPCGGLITLEKTAAPDQFLIGYRAKKRTQREFVRLAVVADDELTFEMRRQPMAVEFDETVIMLDDSHEASDRLWRRATAGRTSVVELLRHVFRELAKLSPQGTVHFNTLYSAVNVLRRCPPEPILAELSLDWRYIAVGSGYYALDERATTQER